MVKTVIQLALVALTIVGVFVLDAKLRKVEERIQDEGFQAVAGELLKKRKSTDQT